VEETTVRCLYVVALHHMGEAAVRSLCMRCIHVCVTALHHMGEATVRSMCLRCIHAYGCLMTNINVACAKKVNMSIHVDGTVYCICITRVVRHSSIVLNLELGIHCNFTSFGLSCMITPSQHGVPVDHQSTTYQSPPQRATCHAC
jgi:hypothetical protein